MSFISHFYFGPCSFFSVEKKKMGRVPNERLASTFVLKLSKFLPSFIFFFISNCCSVFSGSLHFHHPRFDRLGHHLWTQGNKLFFLLHFRIA